jgi:hypothetical protein
MCVCVRSRTKLFQSAATGVSDWSSCASCLFGDSASLSHPTLRVWWQVVHAHCSQWGDGGLLCMALGSGLLQTGLERTLASPNASTTAPATRRALSVALILAGWQVAQHWTSQFLVDPTASASAAAASSSSTSGVRAPIAVWRWNEMPVILRLVLCVEACAELCKLHRMVHEPCANDAVCR